MAESNPFTKAQTIDPEVKAYVTNLVTALGGSSADDDGHYALGDDAILVLRDLKRWLKLYDEKTNRLDVARCLAEADLIRGDLLPILSLWTASEKDKRKEKLHSRLALSCLELLVPLTWPIELEEMTANHHRHAPYIQQAQVKYKAAALHWDHTSVLRQAVRIALPSISLKRDERETRDEGIIKLMLYFLRNIASIQQIPSLPSQGLENEVSRSATILAFRDQDVFALLLMICSNMGDDFNLEDVVVLEILFNLLKGVDVRRLWMTQDQQRGQNISDLQSTLKIEDNMQREAKKKEWSRHGRFGTMIWMKRDDEKMAAISGQDNLKNSQTALFNIDNTKKWNKPQQRRKDMDHNSQDFDRAQDLSPQAADCLRNFVQELLDSGFNPLFNHLRKAIEREAERLLPINYRQFFYVVSWFLQAERIRREHQKNGKPSAQAGKDFDPESYALVAAVLNQETFITLNRYMQMSLDDKSWQDLNASMRCFTQILLTVQDMAQSPLEEDRDIAENIQNRIFYEETTHDRVRTLLAGYKDQGLGYLDAVTELSHVFLRMLERYSKENTNLQIRSKRKANRKRKEDAQQANPDTNAEEHNADLDEEEEEEIREAAQISRERKFDFNRFAAKFTNQSTVNTYATLLRYFKDLDMDQLKRAHRFFHRAAFKQDMAVLLYRVDIIALFYRLIEGPEGLNTKHEMYFEWQELTKQLFRKLFKKLDQRPELMIEMLFSKIPSTLYYLEYGHDKQTSASNRAPAELEVKPAPGRDRKEQIGITVTVLLNDGQFDLVDFVKRNVTKAFDERHAWEAEAEARKALAQDEIQRDHADSSGPPTEDTEPTTQLAPAQPSYITIQPSSEAIRLALHKNARLILLMNQVGFEPHFASTDPDNVTTSTYTVPSTLSASHLSDSLEAITQHMQQPWTGLDEDDTPESQLRRARKQPSHHSNRQGVAEEPDARRDAFIDDDEGSDALPSDTELFPDNPRAKPKKKSLLEQLKEKRRKRKRKRSDDSDAEDAEEVDDDMAAERRRKREENALARRRKIKSDLFVHDSDDESDVEKDREFFAREETLRLKQSQHVREQMALQRAEAENNATKKTKKRKSSDRKEAGQGKKRRKTMDSDAENSDTDQSEDDADLGISSPSQSSSSRSAHRRRRTSLSTDTDEENSSEETPATSPPPASSPAKPTTTQRNILQELRQGRSSRKVAGSKTAALLMDGSADGVMSISEGEGVAKVEHEGTGEKGKDGNVDEDDVVVSTFRKRGGFVIDDDDDE